MRIRDVLGKPIIILLALLLAASPVYADSGDVGQQTVYVEEKPDYFSPIIKAFRELVKAVKTAINGENPNDQKMIIIKEAIKHIGESSPDSVSFLHDVYSTFGYELTVSETRNGDTSWSECGDFANNTYNFYYALEPGDILAWYIIADNVTGSPDMSMIYVGPIKGSYIKEEASEELMISTKYGTLRTDKLTLDTDGFVRDIENFEQVNSITVIDGIVSFFDYHNYVDENGYHWPSYTHLYCIK